MKGKPVGVCTICVASPRVKHRVTTMMKPKTALRPTAQLMARGNVSEASLISSAVDSLGQRPWNKENLRLKV